MTRMSQKTLILLRHAKAEAGQDDHARPLAERGVEEAKRMGAHMAEHGIVPLKILCSTSTRTRQTLDSLSRMRERVASVSEPGEGGNNPLTRPRSLRSHGHPLPQAGEGIIEFSSATYNASEAQHLKNIAAQSDDIKSLMIIAHNPGLHQLALRLSREGDHAQLRQMAQEFPPCSLVVIDLGDISWSDVSTARGALRMFVTPKMI